MSSKRSPFVDAPSDLANRHRSDPSESSDGQLTQHEPNSRDPTAGRKRPQLEPPPSMIQGGRGGGGTANKFRARYQQKIISASNKVNHHRNSTNNNNVEDAEMRARRYKAEAYEAKIRIASQEQRMNTLEQELEELRFFAAVEQGTALEKESSNTNTSSNHNDPPPNDEDMLDDKQNSSEKDAELIECLAAELEDTEKELNQIKRLLKEELAKNKLNEEVESRSKVQLDNLQHELDAEKNKNESMFERLPE